jgi:hypothetical protein
VKAAAKNISATRYVIIGIQTANYTMRFKNKNPLEELSTSNPCRQSRKAAAQDYYVPFFIRKGIHLLW